MLRPSCPSNSAGPRRTRRTARRHHDSVAADPNDETIRGDYACIGLEDEGLILHDVKRADGELWW